MYNLDHTPHPYTFQSYGLENERGPSGLSRVGQVDLPFYSSLNLVHEVLPFQLAWGSLVGDCPGPYPLGTSALLLADDPRGCRQQTPWYCVSSECGAQLS